MNRHITALALSLCFVVSMPAFAQQSASPSTREIDMEIWSILVATVANDDIKGMGAVYMPTAVLVSPRSTAAIKDTLDRWGADMVTAKAKGNKASVEFRFSQRLDNATTAFERGMFKYTVIEKSGASTPKHYPFEQLLVKVDGKWRIAMERQFAEVPASEWDKLAKQ